MSTPDPNDDDTGATERLNQNGDVETAKVQSVDTEPPHEDKQELEDDRDATESSDPSERITELEALIDVLRTENNRLRTDYARARKVSHRKTALALAAIGVMAVLGGVMLPDVRPVLFVTGAIGLFGGVLTWFLTPARVVPVSVGESVYDAATTTLAGLRDELGLQAITVYVPVGDRTRGFIPRDREFELPENVAHAFPNDTDGSQGLSFAPSGQQLTREVDRIRTTKTPDTALDAIEQIADSLVEHFEVADRIAVEKEAEFQKFTVSVDKPAFGSLTRLDHPIVSALACAAAQAVDEPVVINSTEETRMTLEVISKEAFSETED